jgi:methylmalonyl-CoA mutase cobalamin-binding domain/chain
MAVDHIERGLTDYCQALAYGDGRAAHAVFDSLIDAGVSFEELCEDVVRPALYDVGERWASGEATVGDEHVATAISDAILACVGTFSTAPLAGRYRALVCCTDGELHAVGARMVAETFAAAEWSVQYLGASMPAHAVASAVVEREADVLALSTTMADRLPEVTRTIDAVREARPELRVVVGGQAYRGDDARARKVGATLLHDGLRGLVDRVEDALPG